MNSNLDHESCSLLYSLQKTSNEAHHGRLILLLKRKISQSCSILCLPSKAAVYIVFSAFVVGIIYYSALGAVKAILDAEPETYAISISVNYCLPYASLALIMIFYPLSGFIADVYCGRFKTIVCSFCFLFASLFLLCFIGVAVTFIKLHVQPIDILPFVGTKLGIFFLISSLVSSLFFIFGLVGYQANVIQFGLDQLFEAQSHYLGLFIHYTSWAFHLGAILPLASFPLLWCDHLRSAAQKVLCSIAVFATLSLIILFAVTRWKKHWFYTEAGQENPYKAVLGIINFAKRHKHPLQRSAFTYADNYIPSRLDFAKERYGGPFTIEQVENVKTLIQILLILFAMGPVLMLEVPASYFVFQLFSLHTLHYYEHMGKEFCSTSEHTWEIMLVSSSSLMTLLSTLILFPSYVYVIFSFLRQRSIKLFSRIKLGIGLCLLGVLSLFIIDLVGHSLQHSNPLSQTLNNTQCMFQFYRTNDTLKYPALKMHWSVLFLPNLLLGIGPLIVITTTFEFISAQSPQSMKGLTIGVFFAIRGLFQFLNSIIIIPFSLKHPWASGEMLENPPVTNCGFVYLLFTCVVGLIGLILFSVAAKKYKHRQRDEGMFRQHDVEEIYDRYLTEKHINSADED